MRTINKTRYVHRVGDSIVLGLDKDRANYILEIEIDVPDEKERAEMDILQELRETTRNGDGWFLTKANELIQHLTPRPPRATIREVEK